KPGDFQTDLAGAVWRGKPLYFAGVRSGKSYTSFYFMPVYCSSALLRSMSPELKRRMQGRACFNFKQVDDALFAELAQLIRTGLQHYTVEKLQKLVASEALK